MKTLMSVTLLLTVALVGNCHAALRMAQSTLEFDSNEKVTIYYERTACPNKCPVYWMTIRPDRTVEYEGKEFTRVLGKRTYTISAEAYQAILEAVRQAQVERLADEYGPVPGRDEGTVILRVSWGEKTKQIYHLLPSPDAPEELIELEAAIVKNAYPRDESRSTPN